MRRRDFIAGVGGAVLAALKPFSLAAQPLASGAKVGFLHPRLSAVVEALRLVAIREGLGLSGPGGSPLELVSRVSDGNLDRLAAYARELAAMKVDVIIAISPSGVMAARAATKPSPSWPWIWRQTRSPVASSRAWADRAPMSRACSWTSLMSAPNASSSSTRSSPACG